MLQNVCRQEPHGCLLANSLVDIPSGDISNILSRLSKKVYVTQEVIFGSGEPVTPAQYTGNGMFYHSQRMV